MAFTDKIKKFIDTNYIPNRLKLNKKIKKTKP